MAYENLKLRTKKLSLEIISFVQGLPRNYSSDVIGRQVLRSGTSIGANYRAACRAKSPADFIAKMGIVEEEADETAYWLELLMEMKLTNVDQLQRLLKEVNELVAIVVSSIVTAKRNKDFRF